MSAGQLSQPLGVLGQGGGIGVQQVPRRAFLAAGRGGPAGGLPPSGPVVNPLPVLRVAQVLASVWAYSSREAWANW